MNTYTLLFDAVGTLLHPVPSVFEAYYEIGKKHSSPLNLVDIAEKFPAALSQHFPDNRNEALLTSESLELKRWKAVVDDVFGQHSSDNPELFRELWYHFSMPHHWCIYDDMKPILKALVEANVSIGIASNFDFRLLNISRFHFPYIDTDNIFYSSKIGFAKPHRRFFQCIEDSYNTPTKQFVLVGDDHDRDIKGAQSAGWLAIHRDDVSSLLDVLAI